MNHKFCFHLFPLVSTEIIRNAEMVKKCDVILSRHYYTQNHADYAVYSILKAWLTQTTVLVSILISGIIIHANNFQEEPTEEPQTTIHVNEGFSFASVYESFRLVWICTRYRRGPFRVVPYPIHCLPLEQGYLVIGCKSADVSLIDTERKKGPWLVTGHSLFAATDRGWSAYSLV